MKASLLTNMTPRLKLPLAPYGVSGATAVETYSIAMAMLEIASSATVLSRGDNTPPASPSEGDCYIIGPTPVQGDWYGHAKDIAGYYNGDWIFVEKFKGLHAYVQDESLRYYFTGTGWTSF